VPPELETSDSVPPEPLLARAADAYLDAFSRPPYLETDDSRTAFVDRLRRYESRGGFRLALACQDDEVPGLALAVVARPGDWYRERVAEQLDEAEVDEWLGDSCLELVHLAVRPDREGHGIGGALHDAVLTGAPADTAILTVHPEGRRARRLYERRGWRVLRERVSIGAARDFILMTRRLP
jgi:GNAT superfamily N-acetyltransferase